MVELSVKGFVDGEYDYYGIFYIGLMLIEDGFKVIEYNVCLGDLEI